MAGIKPAEVSAILRQQLAGIKTEAELQEVIAQLSTEIVLHHGIGLLGPDIVAIETARHLEVGIAVGAAVSYGRHRVVTAVFEHSEVVEVAVSAVKGVHVEAADRLRISHLTRLAYQGHGHG